MGLLHYPIWLQIISFLPPELQTIFMLLSVVSVTVTRFLPQSHTHCPVLSMHMDPKMVHTPSGHSSPVVTEAKMILENKSSITLAIGI